MGTYTEAGEQTLPGFYLSEKGFLLATPEIMHSSNIAFQEDTHVARRLLVWTLGFLMLVSILPHVASAATAPSAKKPAVGGQLNLVMMQDPDSLNPVISSTANGSQVYSLIYSSLFEYSDSWEPQPNLAQSWETSADRLTFTIKLREGVKFHNGTELTAEDVVYTYQVLMDPTYTGPRKANVASFKAISAPDRYTVRIDLKEPQASIFSSLSTPILSKQQFAGVAVKDLATAPGSRKPVGSGPYMFYEYKPGNYVSLLRNANYFRSKELGGAPFISKIVIRIIPDYADIYEAFVAGEIDELALESREVTDQIRAKNFPVEYDRNGWGYFTLNTEGLHLSNKLVRQALTHAMDRRLIVRREYGPEAKVPAGPIPSVSWAYDQNLKPLEHDSVKAIDLLEEAGYKLNARGYYEKDGEQLTVRLGITNSRILWNIAYWVTAQYAMVGIQVEIEAKDFAELQADMAAGDFDMVYTGFSLGLDPDSLYALFHSSQTDGFNRSRYSNPAVDELLEAGRREADMAKRKEIYAEVQQQLIEDAPVILLVSQHYSDWVSKKVKGGVRNFPGSGAADYHLWWINEK